MGVLEADLLKLRIGKLLSHCWNKVVDERKIEITYQYDGTGFFAEFSKTIEKRVVVSLTRVWGYVSNTDAEWPWVQGWHESG